VIDKDDCERYQDALDRLFEGAASEDDERRLREHAAGCPDCAVLLELHRELRGASLAELEEAVPAAMVDGMWSRLDAELSPASRREVVGGRRVIWRWVAAAQAAAIVLLAAGVVYLFDELNTMKNREADLSGRISTQQQYLSELDRRTPPARRDDGTWAAGAYWERKLGGTDEVSIAQIAKYLSRLPADFPVLDARGTRRLLSGLSAGLPGAARGSRPEGLEGLQTGDGLKAGEALKLIEELDLDPSYRLPTSRIMSLTKSYD
jgi:hypothetical protein